MSSTKFTETLILDLLGFGSGDVSRAEEIAETLDIKTISDYVEGMGVAEDWTIGSGQTPFDLVEVMYSIGLDKFKSEISSFCEEQEFEIVPELDSLVVNGNSIATNVDCDWEKVFSNVEATKEQISSFVSEFNEKFNDYMSAEGLAMNDLKVSDIELMNPNESKIFAKSYTQFLNESKKRK